MYRPDTVTCEIDVRLVAPGDEGIPLAVTLRYDRRDPYAVRATFRAVDGSVEWVFARDLLGQGLLRTSGEGDVRVWPAWVGGSASRRSGRVVCIALSSPDGQALLEAPAGELSDFVTRMFELVPQGTEANHLRLDAELAELLG